jgi:hypothetical protein
MSNGRLDIDAIVREVVQRLMQPSAAPPEPRPASAAVVAPASAAGPGHQPPVTSAPLSAASTPVAPPKPADLPGTLRLGERLITLATLEGRLRGIRRVAVGRSAVVTPSVRDVLGRQDIALVREDLQCAGSATLLNCSVRVTGTDFGAAALSSQLGLPVVSVDRVTEAVKQSVRDIRCEQKLAVVITRQTALALCLANRHRRVRAAIARCEETVRDAVGSIGANLLVIDPRRPKPEELPRLIRIFAEGGSRDCPHEYAQLLEETV